MRKFKADKDGWYCGFWNNSPLSISFASRKELYAHEKLHYHKDFYEYYLVIDGEMTLIVNKKRIPLKKHDLLMIEPREIHKVINLCPGSCAYVNIKQKSYKNGTTPIKE